MRLQVNVEKPRTRGSHARLKRTAWPFFQSFGPVKLINKADLFLAFGSRSGFAFLEAFDGRYDKYGAAVPSFPPHSWSRATLFPETATSEAASSLTRKKSDAVRPSVAAFRSPLGSGRGPPAPSGLSLRQ